MDQSAVSEHKVMSKWWRSPVALFRISSALYAVTALGHASAYPWSSTGEQRAAEVIALMKDLQFVFLGESSTYWNLYFGWGNLVVVCLFAFAVVLWLLSDLARVDARSVGAIACVISAASFVAAWISFRFFYMPPFVSYLVSCVALAMAAVELRRRT